MSKLALIIFKDPADTAKKTEHFTIKKLNFLMLLKKLIAVHAENYTKPINTLGNNAELFIVEVGGTYSYHWNLSSG
jgi:hypothetical protein